MANYAAAWDETIPTGGESRSLGDNRIRELKSQLSERLSTEHTDITDSSGDKELIHKAGQCTVFYVGTTAEIAALTNSFATANLCCIAFDTTLGAVKYFNGTTWTICPFDFTNMFGAGDPVHTHLSDAEGGLLTPAAMPISTIFGAPVAKSIGTIYQAATDGILVASVEEPTSGYGCTMQVLSDSATPPTTVRGTVIAEYDGGYMKYATITVPILKTDYYKVLKGNFGRNNSANEVFIIYFYPITIA
jgi:hypothetical protein